MKSYTDELAEWVDKRAKKKRRQDTAAVAFLAVRPNVKEAIDAGYALSTIWEHMHETGKLKCSYETFRKHVRRHMKPTTQADPKTTPKAGAQTSTGKESKDDQKTKTTKVGQKKDYPLNGFTFNATPKKEELF
ncbi:TraK family protein [Methylomicrobium lacus]|uniref:TraK family protein n=1 Tax=Methylomicrobium lacus TaxID=136992 RepID=UPI0035A84D40